MSFDGEKDPKDIIRDELRAKLRAKIGEDRIKRSSKKQKDEILKKFAGTKVMDPTFCVAPMLMTHFFSKLLLYIKKKQYYQ